jgi:hypothetical protein
MNEPSVPLPGNCTVSSTSASSPAGRDVAARLSDAQWSQRRILKLAPRLDKGFINPGHPRFILKLSNFEQFRYKIPFAMASADFLNPHTRSLLRLDI